MNKNNKIPLFKLIAGNEGKYRVSSNVTNEFERAILKSNMAKATDKNSYFISRFFYRFWKNILISKFIHQIFTAIFRLFFFGKKDYMVVLMGPRFPKCFPHFFRKGYKAVYMFDAWPSYYNYIIRFVKDFNIDYLFISSNQSTKALNQKMDGEKVFWIPEGVDPDEYNYYPLNKKDIDVLYFGRKYTLFHEKIVSPLLNQNISYKFSVEGEMVFKDRKSFIDGLARTKISVCFPTNVTHPERAGGVETMTNRYLQSMASKCLILGKAPKEMIDLFGYNPVVEVDMDNPAVQIVEILKNFEIYTELIEKNYISVIKNHSWKNRWESIASVILEKMKQKELEQ